MTPDPWCKARRHGDQRIDYRRGCRCTAARKAEAIDRQRRYAEFPAETDGTGTGRRLRALAALGWPAYEIAARMGVTHQCIEQWRRGRDRVRCTTHARITALYDELSMTVGPSADTRRRALRYGWPPPLAWDDDTIDDPTARPWTDEPQPLDARRIPFDDVVLLAESGETWERVEQRIGFPRNSIATGLARNGLRHISARISRNGEVNGEPRNQWTA